MKFLTNPTKAVLEMKDISNDSFFANLKEFLNEAEIDSILNIVLEIEPHDSYPLNDLDSLPFSIGLKYVNKLFLSKSKGMSDKMRFKLQSVISMALETLSVILSLVYVHHITLKKKDANKKWSYYHQFHTRDLDAVTLIKDSILSESSLLTEIDENKIIFTILSYINFERKYKCFGTDQDIDLFVNATVSTHSTKDVSSNALKC